MKKLAILLVTTLTLLSGCERGLTERERECAELTGNIRCNSQVDDQIRLMNAQEDLMEDGVYAQPTNFYGDPRYGQWDNNGSFQFYNAQSPEAISTNSFLLGAGLGTLATYALTRDGRDSSRYRSKYKSYYNNPKYSNKDYIKNQKIRSQQKEIARLKQQNKAKEMQRRKMQSQRDKALNANKKKHVQKTTVRNKPTNKGINLSKKPVMNKKPSVKTTPSKTYRKSSYSRSRTKKTRSSYRRKK